MDAHNGRRSMDITHHQSNHLFCLLRGSWLAAARIGFVIGLAHKANDPEVSPPCREVGLRHLANVSKCHTSDFISKTWSFLAIWTVGSESIWFFGVSSLGGADRIAACEVEGTVLHFQSDPLSGSSTVES